MPPKIVRKTYDGTIDSVYLQEGVREALMGKKDEINQYLEYYYRDRAPSLGTLWRWAKDGLPLLPHQKHGAKFEGDPIRRAKRVIVASTSAYSLKYTDKTEWAKIAWKRLKKRAALTGLAFNIHYKDVIPPDKCPVLGHPLIIGGGRGYEAQKTSPSVDRFDNSKGYVKGNVRIISKRANSLKSDATMDEVKKLLAYMRS